MDYISTCRCEQPTFLHMAASSSHARTHAELLTRARGTATCACPQEEEAPFLQLRRWVDVTKSFSSAPSSTKYEAVMCAMRNQLWESSEATGEAKCKVQKGCVHLCALPNVQESGLLCFEAWHHNDRLRSRTYYSSKARIDAVTESESRSPCSPSPCNNHFYL